MSPAGGMSLSRLGLAVSGGSDSMAMLHLLAPLALDKGWQLEVVTVDHRLRPEAAEEAAFVGKICQGYGLHHQTLVWQDHPKSGNLMQAASAARYDLMAEWAKARGLCGIFLGHTADDQAETFLMGLARGAGLDGLTGMRAEWLHQGLKFHRPLLHVTRQELRDGLRAAGHEWRDDPSNENTQYQRVKMRNLKQHLTAAGIEITALTQSISHLATAQNMLRLGLADLVQKICREEGGALILDRAGFAAAPMEMLRRLLVAALRWMGGARHAPRAEATAFVIEALLAGQSRVLGGCRLRVTPRHIRISREPRSLSPALVLKDADLAAALSDGVTWDHRWHLRGPFHAEDVIRALGAEGLAACPGWKDLKISRDALAGSPSVWRGGKLLGAPLTGLGGVEWDLSLQPSFGMFVITH